MQNSEDHPILIPWKTREVWLGVAFVGLWWLVIVAAAILLQILELDLNLGLFVGLAELLLLVPVWWFAVRKYRVGWDTLGLRGFEGKMVGLGCGLMLLSFMFNFVYNIFLALFDLSTQVDLAPVFAELSSPWWLLLAGVVVAPVVEEIFFRGFVFAGLRQRYDWQKAALISSFLFALIHLQPTATIPIFILGYIFAYLYERSGSIGPAILMHISTNALALGTAYLVANTELAG
jgi:membrane protease YdiL (CAAX protease family)